ncbi:MAG: hypothetical protein PHV68_06390 [Candidatus Gastranaerophilales bacterium]|nr:hypothetical protein [Candidatus Gastranaerophilales bacterium]
MDKNKNKRKAEKSIYDLMLYKMPYYSQLDAIQKFTNRINFLTKPILDWVNTINLNRVFQSLETSFDIIDDIKIQLSERNIDFDVIGNVYISQIVELYLSSKKVGITFADLVEDNLKLFGNFKYSKAVIYLNRLDSRKSKIINKDTEFPSINNKLCEDLKYTEKELDNFIKIALKEYKDGNIIIKDEERALLDCLKQNRYLKNKDIAEKLDYGIRGIESICARIRKKFNIDYIKEKSVKRHLLINLSKYI